jgi:antitoxin component of MazEF toxin-antitoxin module
MYARRLKIRYNGGNTQLTIPRDLVRQMGLVPGMEFDIHCTGEQIVIDLTTVERSKLFDPPAEALEPVEAA